MTLIKPILCAILLFSSEAAFAEPWARFTCFLQIIEGETETIDQKNKIVLEVGLPQEGYPLVSLTFNDLDLQPLVKQYQFEFYSQKSPDKDKEDIRNLIRSHLVWLENNDSNLTSEASNLTGRKLSVAKIETIIKVLDGIETREYKINKITTHVDVEDPSKARERSTYKCLEPEIF